MKESEKLSKYVTYGEAIRSDYAIRNGIDNTPSEQQLANIKYLCVNLLDKIREFYGKPIIINSIYRCPVVNTGIGGSKTSEHMALGKSAACDFTIKGISVNKLFNDIRNRIIPFIDYNQVIQELGYWVHISLSQAENKRQALICYRVDGHTHYDNA